MFSKKIRIARDFIISVKSWVSTSNPEKQKENITRIKEHLSLEDYRDHSVIVNLWERQVRSHYELRNRDDPSDETHGKILERRLDMAKAHRKKAFDRLSDENQSLVLMESLGSD